MSYFEVERSAQLTSLKEHEEEAEESRHDDVAGLSGESLVMFCNDDDVGTLSCPQWSGTQTHQHRRRYHRAPDRVAVSCHVDDVTEVRYDDSPSMSDETDHRLRYEQAGDHQRGVEDAQSYDAHAFVPVQGALQPTEALECIEVKQERDADDDDVLPDSSLLPFHLDVCCGLRVDTD